MRAQRTEAATTMSDFAPEHNRSFIRCSDIISAATRSRNVAEKEFRSAWRAIPRARNRRAVFFAVKTVKTRALPRLMKFTLMQVNKCAIVKQKYSAARCRQAGRPAAADGTVG